MASLYRQLCPVSFGSNAVSEMAAEAAKAGFRRAFIVCDQGVRKAGIADKLQKDLTANEISNSVFDGCIPDAPDTFIDELAETISEWNPDLILGVGGGSSMDAAKAAGVVVDNGQSIRTYMQENGNPGFTVKTPVYVIPTTAGTGSECTPMCVIHEMSTDTKKVVLRPAELAVLDPDMTMSCPASVTANSGMDALSHAVEAYTSVNPNPKDKLLAIHAIRLIADNLPICIAEPGNCEARTNMLFASNIAGIAFAEMSVHIGHCFAHEAGLRFHMNHGLACALSVPETIEFVANEKQRELKDIGAAFGTVITEEMSAAEVGKAVANSVRSFMKECGIKSLAELGISRDEVIELAESALANNWFHIMCPREVTADLMKDYCAKTYDNYR